jgi:S1-C subfamily serine protease
MSTHSAFLRLATLPLAALLLFVASCRGPKTTDSAQPLGDSVLRVTATIQYPDVQRPWLKKQPFSRAGLGTVIEGGRLLVTADLVAHATYIELEKSEDGPKGTATVEAIDEECNLAVLKPVERDLLQGTKPLPFDTSVRTGSELEILQLEPNGAPALSPATVTTVAVMPYPSEDAAYLTYRASTVIPLREGSFVIPALHEGKLAGLVMRYDPKIQSADIIPAALIERFLAESAKPDYRGLARAGLSWEQVRGSTLREWLGASPDHNGVYVTWVEPDGPAAKAGIRKGDLLLKAAGHEIDGEGNYLDPEFGKITFNNLASLESAPGDPMEITYFRSSGEGKGATNTSTLRLEGRNPTSEISPSRIDGETVPYVFLGGLLFQELSRPYLKEWGGDWQRQAPQNLVYLDAFQNELPLHQGRLVILSEIFPSEQTVGFEDLSKRVVESINGREIHSIADVTEAAKHPENGFEKIILDGSVGPIFLDASTLAAEEESVRAEYGIPPASGLLQ